MAPCSHPGQTQGREWWVSPRRLLSIGQPRTANPAGEHDTSAKKASLPGHCTCKRLRGPHEDRKKYRPPVTLAVTAVRLSLLEGILLLVTIQVIVGGPESQVPRNSR